MARPRTHYLRYAPTPHTLATHPRNTPFNAIYPRILSTPPSPSFPHCPSPITPSIHPPPTPLSFPSSRLPYPLFPTYPLNPFSLPPPTPPLLAPPPGEFLTPDMFEATTVPEMAGTFSYYLPPREQQEVVLQRKRKADKGGGEGEDGDGDNDNDGDENDNDGDDDKAGILMYTTTLTPTTTNNDNDGGDNEDNDELYGFVTYATRHQEFNRGQSVSQSLITRTLLLIFALIHSFSVILSLSYSLSHSHSHSLAH